MLAGFMGGLALGNALAAGLGTRWARPLAAYAALELAVALSGVALVYALPGLAPALAPRLAVLLAVPGLQSAARLGIAFAVLLVPSTAMGMTLPLLTQALSRRDANFGRVLGRLYGWNTLGAVAGAVLSETWLIGALGVRGSALAVGATSALAAAAAGALARSAASRSSPIPPGPTRRHSALPWLAAAFLSGFALLALEVVWFRFLSLFVLTRAEAFAWMLGLALAGIGAGGLAASRALARRPDAHRFAAPLALGTGALCAGSYLLLPPVLERTGPAKLTSALAILGLGAPLMLPVCLASGMLFTALGAGLRPRLASEAGATGALGLCNTLGAALGAALAGFALLPALGVERSLFALAALYGLTGALLWAAAPAPRRAARGAAGLLLASLAAFPFGRLEQRSVRQALEAYGEPADSPVTLREGAGETLLLVENRVQGRPYYHRLVTNSFSMSGTDVQSRRYMKLYVYWPAAVHPELRSALLIGYGLGSTARALVDTRSLERIDVVEVSRDVLALSGIVYPSAEANPLRDPRVSPHVEDGRYFLETSARRYDLITAEPPPPMVSGVVHLYTREYFQLVYDHLAEGGIATYWLPLRSLSDAGARSVLRAFCDVFRDCSLWNGMEFNLMLVGTRGARGPVSRESFERQWRDPAVLPELRALGFERPEQLGALFVGDADWLDALTRGTPPLVDDWPRRISAPASSPEEQTRLFAGFFDPRARRERFRSSALVAELWPAALAADALPYFELQHLLDTFGYGIRSDLWSERLSDLAWVLSDSSLRTPALWLLGSDADVQRLLAGSDAAARSDPELQLQRALGRLADRDYAAALEPLELAEAAAATAPRALPLRLFALCRLGRRDEARELAEARFALLGRGEAAADFWRWLQGACGVVPSRHFWGGRTPKAETGHTPWG